MNKPDEQDHLPRRRAGSGVPWFVVALGLPIAAALYMVALTGFFRWEERSATSAEFIRRAQIRNMVYAPVIWLKEHDPSGAVRVMIQWEYRMAHKESFDANRLQ